MLQKDPELTRHGCAKNKNWRTTVCEKAQNLPETSPATSRTVNVQEGQSQRCQVLCPSVGSPHPGAQSAPRWAQSPGVCAAVTGKVPGSGLPADPGEGGGAPSAHPGAWTLAIVQTLVLAVRSDPPPAHWLWDPAPPSPTSLWAPGLRCYWPHGPTRQSHSHPWTVPCPPEGPGPGPTHQCTGVPLGPLWPCSQRPSPREQQGCFSLRTSLTQQQADASPGHPQLCRLASRLAPVLGPAGPRVLPTCK